MKKIYQLEDLDCASCAAKIEKAIGELPGVSTVSVNFMFQKLTLDAADDEFETVLKKAKKIIKKVEPGCSLLV